MIYTLVCTSAPQSDATNSFELTLCYLSPSTRTIWSGWGTMEKHPPPSVKCPRLPLAGVLTVLQRLTNYLRGLICHYRCECRCEWNLIAMRSSCCCCCWYSRDIVGVSPLQSSQRDARILKIDSRVSRLAAASTVATSCKWLCSDRIDSGIPSPPEAIWSSSADDVYAHK